MTSIPFLTMESQAERTVIFQAGHTQVASRTEPSIAKFPIWKRKKEKNLPNNEDLQISKG